MKGTLYNGTSMMMMFIGVPLGGRGVYRVMSSFK